MGLPGQAGRYGSPGTLGFQGQAGAMEFSGQAGRYIRGVGIPRKGRKGWGLRGWGTQGRQEGLRSKGTDSFQVRHRGDRGAVPRADRRGRDSQDRQKG